MKKETNMNCLKSISLSFTALMVCGIINAAERPNIVYILCDDLGTGDVQCLSKGKGKIATPNFDRLAKGGMTFTDAHSGSAVCTPTRYGVLTGRYAWRSRLQKSVLWGNSRPLISKGRETAATVLKRAGYNTACIGKWHLGLGWVGEVTDSPMLKGCKVDYSKPLTDSPVSHGFDYFFGISASLDMAPYTWIENFKVTELPTAIKAFHRKGPAGPSFEAVDVLPTITAKAIEYFKQCAPEAKTGKKPFFLYLPYASPHTPIVPTEEWKGKSGLNKYADFVMQTDFCVGQLIESLKELGLLDNTLVVFTSDNGCSPAANVKELVKKGHYPSADYRGYKADIWEGGHRVPFICHWPKRVKAGSTSTWTTCLTDLIASCADLSGEKIPEDAGEDSVSFIPALLSGGDAAPRVAVIHHSIQGKFAIRKGDWKMALCPGSGGWASPKDPQARKQGLPEVQLYNVKDDIAETNNLQAQNPEKVEELTKLLKSYVDRGRSTPGPDLQNDVPVDMYKN
jgi:arylsulfatase A